MKDRACHVTTSDISQIRVSSHSQCRATIIWNSTSIDDVLLGDMRAVSVERFSHSSDIIQRFIQSQCLKSLLEVSFFVNLLKTLIMSGIQGNIRSTFLVAIASIWRSHSLRQASGAKAWSRARPKLDRWNIQIPIILLDWRWAWASEDLS